MGADGEENVKTRKKNRWTQAMLELLIKVWSKYYPELKLNSRGHDKIYAKIVEELAMVGCTASMEDVRGRIHNLSGKYRKEAAAVSATGRRSQWPYFYKISKFFDYVVPVHVTTNRPVLYDMSQYLELDYAMEDSLDLEGNGRVLIREGRLSDEEHLEDGLGEDDDRSEPHDWRSEHLEDEINMDEYSVEDANNMDEESAEGENNMEEDSAEDGEEGPLVEVLPGEAEPNINIEPTEPGKDPCELDKATSECNKDASKRDKDASKPSKENKVLTPTTGARRSSDKQHTTTQKEKEKSVKSDGGSHTQSPKGKVYRLNSAYRHETIEEFLHVLYSNRLYTDVTIFTYHNGDMCKIPAHQIVLANFSPYFSHMLENTRPAATFGSVVLLLPDVPHSVMHILLEYMYTGGTDVPGELIDDVVRWGTQLKIRGFWSEIRGEAIAKRTAPSSDVNTNKKAKLDVDDTSRSSTPSSTDYDPIRTAGKSTRNKPDDEEGALTDVSSDIGYDLLRSDVDDREHDDEDDDDEDSTDDDEDDDDDNEDDEDDTSNDNKHVDDDDEEDEDDNGDEDDESDDEDDEDDEEDEGDEDDDDDDDDDEDDGDGDDDDGGGCDEDDDEADDDGEKQQQQLIGKQEVHKQKRMVKILHKTNMQTTKEKERRSRKRRLDAPKINGESNSEHSASSRKRKYQVRATTSAANPRDQSPVEKKADHETNDGSSKKNPVKLSGHNILSCKICSQRFPSEDEWLRHVVETHGSDPCILGKRPTENHITMLQCDLCQTYQASERNWLRHVLIKHTE